MSTPQPPASDPTGADASGATATAADGQSANSGSPLGTPVWIAIVIIVGLLAAGLTWLVTGRSGDDSASSVTSSSVVGFTIQEATQVLETQGLQVGEITLQPSDVETGRVLEQNPTAGTSLALGSRVNLVVAGDANPIVPDVLNLSETEAVNALIVVGLRPGLLTRSSSSAPSGEVIAQSPVAGEQVEPGTVVDLRISNGQIGVADVVGLPVAEARAALRNEGFRVSVQEEVSGRVGVVLRQQPEAGAEAALDTVVVLTVGVAEPEPTPTPTPEPTPTPTPTPDAQAVCGKDVFLRTISALRNPDEAPVQFIEDFICVSGWAVAFAAVGNDPDQIVLQRYIFTASGTSWERVSRDRACAPGSGLPDPLREPACERNVS